MKSLYDFIVKPIGDKYSNTVKIGDKNVVVNTKIENWKFVNRLAEVIETPLAFKTGIKKGDIVIMIGDKEIDDIYKYMDILSTLEPEMTTTVTVLRDGNKKVLNVTF